MYYVYILKCNDDSLYTGCTNNLKNRMKRHEAQQVLTTSRRLPVVLVAYTAMVDKYKAFEYEKYLKSGSGRAFLKKHIL